MQRQLHRDPWVLSMCICAYTRTAACRYIRVSAFSSLWTASGHDPYVLRVHAWVEETSALCSPVAIRRAVLAAGIAGGWWKESCEVETRDMRLVSDEPALHFLGVFLLFPGSRSFVNVFSDS